MLFVSCVCHAFASALYSPDGKWPTSWPLFVMVLMIFTLSHWYPGTGVVLYCIDSWSLLSFLLEYVAAFLLIKLSVRRGVGWQSNCGQSCPNINLLGTQNKSL